MKLRFLVRVKRDFATSWFLGIWKNLLMIFKFFEIFCKIWRHVQNRLYPPKRALGSAQGAQGARLESLKINGKVNETGFFGRVHARLAPSWLLGIWKNLLMIFKNFHEIFKILQNLETRSKSPIAVQTRVGRRPGRPGCALGLAENQCKSQWNCAFW